MLLILIMRIWYVMRLNDRRRLVHLVNRQRSTLIMRVCLLSLVVLLVLMVGAKFLSMLILSYLLLLMVLLVVLFMWDLT